MESVPCPHPHPPSAGPELTVARAGGDDWAAIRAVRLAALAESPAAFGSTLRREREFDETRWRGWAHSGAVFLATGDGVPCGLAAGVAGDREDERLLVASVETWARGQGAHSIRLRVMAGNGAARRLYERRGYVDVGRATALETEPEPVVHEMVLDFLP